MRKLCRLFLSFVTVLSVAAEDEGPAASIELSNIAISCESRAGDYFAEGQGISIGFLMKLPEGLQWKKSQRLQYKVGNIIWKDSQGHKYVFDSHYFHHTENGLSYATRCSFPPVRGAEWLEMDDQFELQYHEWVQKSDKLTMNLEKGVSVDFDGVKILLEDFDHNGNKYYGTTSATRIVLKYSDNESLEFEFFDQLGSKLPTNAGRERQEDGDMAETYYFLEKIDKVRMTVSKLGPVKEMEVPLRMRISLAANIGKDGVFRQPEWNNPSAPAPKELLPFDPGTLPDASETMPVHLVRQDGYKIDFHDYARQPTTIKFCVQAPDGYGFAALSGDDVCLGLLELTDSKGKTLGMCEIDAGTSRMYHLLIPGHLFHRNFQWKGQSMSGRLTCYARSAHLPSADASWLKGKGFVRLSIAREKLYLPEMKVPARVGEAVHSDYLTAEVLEVIPDDEGNRKVKIRLAPKSGQCLIEINSNDSLRNITRSFFEIENRDAGGGLTATFLSAVGEPDVNVCCMLYQGYKTVEYPVGIVAGMDVHEQSDPVDGDLAVTAELAGIVSSRNYDTETARKVRQQSGHRDQQSQFVIKMATGNGWHFAGQHVGGMLAVYGRDGKKIGRMMGRHVRHPDVVYSFSGGESWEDASRRAQRKVHEPASVMKDLTYIFRSERPVGPSDFPLRIKGELDLVMATGLAWSDVIAVSLEKNNEMVHGCIDGFVIRKLECFDSEKGGREACFNISGVTEDMLGNVMITDKDGNPSGAVPEIRRNEYGGTNLNMQVACPVAKDAKKLYLKLGRNTGTTRKRITVDWPIEYPAP